MFSRMRIGMTACCVSACLFCTQSLAADPLGMSNPSRAIVTNNPMGQFTLRLVSNPTTGFSWFWVNGASFHSVTPIAHRYIPPTTRLSGAPGIEEWTFQIAQMTWQNIPQVLHVQMQYLRPWSREAKAPLEFTVLYAPLTTRTVVP